MIRAMTALTLAAVTAALPLGGAFADELTQAEIRDELVGRQIVWWEDGGWLAGHLVLSPDGSAEISVDRPRREGDTGRWSLRGGELCTEWGELRAGSEKCYRVRRGEAGRFLTSGGNVFEIREAGV